MRDLALFAGIGGGILGGKLLGWRTVCAVEINDYCRRVLMQRQDDGCLEPFPIWDDIRTFRGLPWRGLVDVVSGGFPCQDISVAGTGQGISGERSGLWTEMARIIREVRPQYALVENSPALTGRGLDVVLGDLAAMGYDARWGVFSAASVGAPHIRERIWVLAHTGCELRGLQGVPSHGHENGLQSGTDWAQGERSKDRELSPLVPGVHPRSPADWWHAQSRMDRSADGDDCTLERLKALGNGQVPIMAARAFVSLGGPVNDPQPGQTP